MKRRKAIVGMLLLGSGYVLADWREEEQAEHQRYIVKLPPCDRVVVIRIVEPADELNEGVRKSQEVPQGPDATGRFYHVQARDFWWKIAAQKTVAGVEAERIANLYRSLKMPPFEVRDLPDLTLEDQWLQTGRVGGRAQTTLMNKLCHFPPFAYRFYAGERLLYDTSICWGCENLITGEGVKRRYFYFRAKEKEAVELYDVSRKLFPEALE